MTLQLEDITIIAANDHYRFGVARIGESWIGFAKGQLEDGRLMVFVMPEISVDFELGFTDREKTIRACSAIIQHGISDYGAVQHWFIPEDQRGTVDDLPYEPECDDWDCFDEDN